MTGELWRRERGGLLLTLRVTPRASLDEVTGLHEASSGAMSLAVKVRALPDKGAANEAVIATLAKAFGLRKSALTLVSGSTGRNKTVLLEGDPRELEQTLAGVLVRLDGEKN